MYEKLFSSNCVLTSTHIGHLLLISATTQKILDSTVKALPDCDWEKSGISKRTDANIYFS